MPTLKIIKSKPEWVQALHVLDNHDFYHTYDYHYLSKIESETPILIYYTEDSKIIAIPFLLRKIFNTDYFDLISVYGYVGPLVKNIDSDFDNVKFIEHFNKFLHENSIISIFSRLHPFIKGQNYVLKGIGEIIDAGKVVNIDIKKEVSEQRALYSKTTKRYLNKTAKLCEVRLSNSKEDLKLFKELYYENMDRVNAHKYYYFSEEYFLNFLECEDFQTDILLAVLKETQEIISAAMIVKTDNFVQYHISGTKNEHLHLTPIRLLIDNARISASEAGYKYFNLGGGLGGSDDSLFYFKSSFSKDFRDFQVWKYVVNPKVYDALSVEFSDSNSKQSFFPLYRNKGF